MKTGNILRVPADVSQLAAVRQFIRDQASTAGADGTATDDLVFAVDESVTNTIVHGYRGQDGSIEVEVDKVGNALVVRLRDHAPPFDPTTAPLPDTTLPPEKRPPGGMGIYLTRELIDEMTYRQTDTGNELTLVRQFSDGQGGVNC